MQNYLPRGSNAQKRAACTFAAGAPVVLRGSLNNELTAYIKGRAISGGTAHQKKLPCAKK